MLKGKVFMFWFCILREIPRKFKRFLKESFYLVWYMLARLFLDCCKVCGARIVVFVLNWLFFWYVVF